MSSTRPDLKFTDTVDERLFYRRFANLPEKEANTVRIVDHKDYFTALEDDAELIADAIYKTLLVIKTSNSKHRYVTISPQVFTSVVRFCLVENNYKVEVYLKQFQLLVTATPGNLELLAVEYGIDVESMLRDALTPVVASVKFTTSGAGKKVGVCLADLLNKALRLLEFEDNDLFSNLELLFLQVNVKEVVLPSSYTPDDDAPGDVVKLFQVLNKIGSVVISSIKLSAYTAKDIDQDLAKIVSAENIDSEAANNVELVLASKGINSSEYTLSLGCCNSLIQYLNLLGGDSASFTIDKYNLNTYMKLDSSTMRALNIFPSTQTMPGPKPSNVSSIFDLLNKCKTASGTRLLSQWLKQPLTDLDAISDRHALVGHLINDTNLRVFVSQEWLTQVPDVKRLLKKIANGMKRVTGAENKKLEDVVRLYQLVTILPELINMVQMSLDDATEQLKPLMQREWLDPLSKNHASLVKFQELVETTIDLSPLESSSSSDLYTDFNIKPEFDELLITINDNLQSTILKIKQVHEQVADDLNIDIEKKLKLEKHQQHGWCFRVTRIDSAILRNTGDNYIELQTVKAGVFFTTRKLRKLSEQYTEYSDEYNSKQKELIKEILSITLTYQTVFLRLSLVLSHIDVIASFANVAIFAPTPFMKPNLHPLAGSTTSEEFLSRRINLKDARHPVLELQEDVNFIANDVNLGNADNDKSFVIITGPNMGGKSTYIRQVGVIALMSQVGSYIPASEDGAPPEVPIFDAILSRVGAGDSQLKGLSTFMIEMLETSSILATATHNSLIIIDELGRGTSTYDGFGLAWSISEHLISVKKCFTLFATHFHELTKLSEKYEGRVQNLHVVAHIEKKGAEEVEDDDITLMYRVEPGISDKSFGIHVAELVKFPTKIINMAKRKASELQSLNAGSDADPYVSNKRTKCSNEEISAGVEKLKTILLSWKDECIDPETQKCKVSSEEAILSLKKLVDGRYSEELKNDKFIQEVLTML